MELQIYAVLKRSQLQTDKISRIFSNRLKTLRGEASQAEFCRRVGVTSQATYARYEAGRIPAGDVLLRMATHLGITVDDLLTDSELPADIEAKSLTRIGLEAPTLALAANTAKQDDTWRRFRMVPIVSSVQAGQAIDFDLLPLEDHQVVPSVCADPRSFALTVRGISMEPLYSEDDVIIVSPAKEKRYENLVVAQLAGVGVTFKLLDVPSAKGMIRLTAYNPAFAPIERPEEDFDWVHAVHSVVRYERS